VAMTLLNLIDTAQTERFESACHGPGQARAASSAGPCFRPASPKVEHDFTGALHVLRASPGSRTGHG